MFALFTVSALGVISSMLLGAQGIQVERMTGLRTGYTQAGAADTSAPIQLQIGLKLQNIDQLNAKLMSISTPGSAQYGQYLDKDDVHGFFKPSSEADGVVLDWLKRSNITTVSNDGVWIIANTTIGQANKLLDTQYSQFINPSGDSQMRTTQYSIPDDVAQYIDVITPTVYLNDASTEQVNTFKPNSARSKLVGLHKRRADASPLDIHHAPHTNCSLYMSPLCLKTIYNIGNYTADPTCGSRAAIASFFGGAANRSDLALFEEVYRIPRTNLTSEYVNLGPGDVHFSEESNLDSQYLTAMSHPLPVMEFVVGRYSYAIPDIELPLGENTNEPWIPFFRYLLNYTNAEIPQVISLSYDDDEQTVPTAYARRVCNMIGMLGLRGISILVASGDSGVGAACRKNDGSNSTRLTPYFPASCPYITTVGGTSGYKPEVAWQGSGGGFSDLFDQPDYQAPAVKHYLTYNLDPTKEAFLSSYTNFTGRAYPDIAAHSASPLSLIVSDGQLATVGGTSASTPVLAGIIALLNDARLRAGKPTLGFLNPWIYSIGNSTGLTDITVGGNTGCTGRDYQTNEMLAGAGIIPGAGFNASEGWDPVTGWGLPNFDELRKLALAL